tara:strand:+ start:922 stop:1308 length:387 start_codon:yes stop_codon:yes gene_type:complete
MTEIAPPVPTPMTLEYLVEVFSDQYTKEQVEGFVERLGLEECAQMAEVHAELRNKSEPHPDEALFQVDEEPVSNLVEAFERQFSHEEAEEVVAGFDGDVIRARNLYRELTEDYASTMTVEDIIKAGKD